MIEASVSTSEWFGQVSATIPVPSPDTDNSADHEVRFACGAPFRQEILRVRKLISAAGQALPCIYRQQWPLVANERSGCMRSQTIPVLIGVS
jgi:hypothetical protein